MLQGRAHVLCVDVWLLLRHKMAATLMTWALCWRVCCWIMACTAVSCLVHVKKFGTNLQAARVVSSQESWAYSCRGADVAILQALLWAELGRRCPQWAITPKGNKRNRAVGDLVAFEWLALGFTDWLHVTFGIPLSVCWCILAQGMYLHSDCTQPSLYPYVCSSQSGVSHFVVQLAIHAPCTIHLMIAMEVCQYWRYGWVLSGISDRWRSAVLWTVACWYVLRWPVSAIIHIVVSPLGSDSSWEHFILTQFIVWHTIESIS